MNWEPKYLRGIRDELDEYSTRLWREVETLADALLPFVQSQGPDTPTVDAEMDGYDGVTHRGPLDRLQLSEWMLLRAAPLEFVRRATQNELSYLRPRRITPQRSETVLVLLDAGPEQLGHPRVLQIALLLAFAHTARARGATFRWAPLRALDLSSAPDALPIYSDISVENVREFLRAKTTRPFGTRVMKRWHDFIDKHPDLSSNASLTGGDAEPPRVWWVGGRTLQALLPADARSITITPDTLGDVRAALTNPEATPVKHLVVSTEVSGVHMQKRLRCLAPQDAAHLLRKPFERRLSPDQMEAVPGALFFTRSDRVVLRAGERLVVAVHVPNSINGSQGCTRQYVVPEGCAVIGAGLIARKTIRLLIDPEGHTTLWTGNKRFRVTFDGDPTPPVFTAHLVRVFRWYDRRYRIHDGHTLWQSTVDGRDGTLDFAPAEGRVFAVDDQRNQWISQDPNTGRISVQAVGNAKNTFEFAPKAAVRAVCVHPSTFGAVCQHDTEVIAYVDSPLVYRLNADDALLLGAAYIGHKFLVYALRDQREIIEIEPGGYPRVLFELPWKAATSAFHHNPRAVAAMSESGAFLVYSVTAGAVIVNRIFPPEDPTSPGSV